MAMSGLTLEDYVNYIKLNLGSPIVWVEIEDYLASIVREALRELKTYISDTETMTLPYEPVIAILIAFIFFIFFWALLMNRLLIIFSKGLLIKSEKIIMTGTIKSRTYAGKNKEMKKHKRIVVINNLIILLVIFKCTFALFYK